MSECDERRVPGMKRVSLATLVEICGNQPGVPAFEAHSLDVSGRGMHVKTAYVPKVGDPLICRFESQGREIVVEGVVAWRREGDNGGDFGIEFTALDSGSVDALRALCGVGMTYEPDGRSERDGEANDADPSCLPGAKVRLHIDGLGSPMKANVREGSQRRLQVGSQLEFLQVGRHLEIEDVGAGARRSARIDSVNVRVDPRSQVPELVVALRYDGVEDQTPEPSVVDRSAEKPGPELPASDYRVLKSTERHPDPEEQQAREAEAEMIAEQQAAEQAKLVYDRLGHAAHGVAQVAKLTGQALARVGQSAASNAGSLFKGAGQQLFKRAEPAPAPRRQTAPPPGSSRVFQTSKLRSQSGRGAPGARTSHAPGAPQAAPSGAAAPTSSGKRRGAKVGVIVGGLVVVAATAAFALRDVDGRDEAPAVVALASSVATPPAAAPAPRKQPPKNSGGIVANVPLFGPTPMATMEPAPLGPAPEPEDEEAREKAAAAASVEDATWSNNDSKAKSDPSDVKPWGRGRMHLPTIHKLRLDAPGGAISGAVNATGFTVVVPGRKVMESGRSIQRRDKRIAQVKTSNTASGAQITFQFRGKVPSYRVRLRKDFAEFLISAPQD